MAAMEWIKCSDKLPEKDGLYLVYRAEGGYLKVFTCDFSTNLNDILPEEYDEDGTPIEFEDPRPGWWDPDVEGDDSYRSEFQVKGITHWMPLPEPPKD